MSKFNFARGLLFYCSIVLLFHCSLPSYILHAQTATIFGKITDKKGVPITEVKISVAHSSPPVFTLSNEKGEYELTVPLSSQNTDTTVTLEFSHLSFGIILKTARVQAGKKVKVDLSADAVRILDTVVIEDKSIRSQFIQTIPVKDIHLHSTASGDFNAILYSQPGVLQSNELSSTYSVRGGNFDENLVYVNDIEVYRPYLVHSGQQEGLSFVNPDLVSSIYFSSGGFESRYGDKMSSVLDIRYRKPREFAGTASASLLGASLHLEGASKDKRLSYLLGIRQKSNSYLLKTLDTKADYKPLFYDVQSYLSYNITNEWETDMLTNISRNKFRMIPQSQKSSFGTVNQALQLTVFFDGQEIDDYQTYMNAITTTYRPYGKDLTLKLIAAGYRAFENETFDILGQYFLDELETDFGNEDFGQSSYNLGTGAFLNHARNFLEVSVYNIEHKGNKLWKEKNCELRWGAKAQNENISDQLSEWVYIDSAGYSLPHPVDSPGYTAPSIQPYQYLELNEVMKTKNNLSSNRYSGYVQHAWRWESSRKGERGKGRTGETENITDSPTRPFSDSLSGGGEFALTTGVRANYWELNRQLLISPRVTFSYKPDWKRDILFKASSGYYYQPPFYREMRDFNGTVHTDLKAQKSIHFVLGSDLNFKSWGRPFKFISEIYYKELDNLIPYEVDNVRLRYYAQNNAKGYAAGIDLKVNGEFVRGVDSWASLSVMKTMEDIKNDFYYIYLNSDGDTIIPGYTSNYIATDSIKIEPGNIPRPMDQRVTFGLFFQDYIPRLPRCKMHLNLLFGSGLPFGPPTFERYKDVLRMPPYRRVDIGFSYEVKRKPLPSLPIGEEQGVQAPPNGRGWGWASVWFSIEVYNLLAVNNVVSYNWVRDVTGRQYAVPNYLSSRLFNARVMVKF